MIDDVDEMVSAEGEWRNFAVNGDNFRSGDRKEF